MLLAVALSAFLIAQSGEDAVFPPWEQRAAAAESTYCPRVLPVIDNSDQKSITDQIRIANMLEACARKQKGVTRARLDTVAVNFLLNILDLHPDEDVARKERARAGALIHEATALGRSDRGLEAHLQDQQDALP